MTKEERKKIQREIELNLLCTYTEGECDCTQILAESVRILLSLPDDSNQFPSWFQQLEVHISNLIGGAKTSLKKDK